MIDPDLCPTHKVEMELVDTYRRIDGMSAYVCDECLHLMYERTTALKLKVAKLKRLWHLSRYPHDASLFEGLK